MEHVTYHRLCGGSELEWKQCSRGLDHFVDSSEIL